MSGRWPGASALSDSIRPQRGLGRDGARVELLVRERAVIHDAEPSDQRPQASTLGR